jgi:hypothetical protein
MIKNFEIKKNRPKNKNPLVNKCKMKRLLDLHDARPTPSEPVWNRHVVLWHHSGGVKEFLARRVIREKMIECAYVGIYLMISLGMPSGPEDFPVPSCLMVWLKESLVIISDSVAVGSPRGLIVNWSRNIPRGLGSMF